MKDLDVVIRPMSAGPCSYDGCSHTDTFYEYAITSDGDEHAGIFCGEHRWMRCGLDLEYRVELDDDE